MAAVDLNRRENADDEADASGTDIRHLTKIDEDFSGLELFQRFLFLGQVFRIRAGHEVSLDAQNADVVSLFDRHDHRPLLGWYLSSTHSQMSISLYRSVAV